MDLAAGTPVDFAGWVADRIERLSRLSPNDGPAFDLSPAEAQRLLAYAGFSLFRATRALELEQQPSGRTARRTRPTEVPV
ncbi:MAG TPA: hypothetical protein VGM69_21280 [Chloroflexota bacterium]|jgi:hypothetical protein